MLKPFSAVNVTLKELKTGILLLGVFAERQAINAPIQGSAADIIRRAMIRIPNNIKPIDGSKMLLQVHDELIFEVPEANANELIEIVTTTMQNAAMPAVDISVPLVVEAHAAKNWNDAH
jgi:DNA polymerase-1